MGDNSVIPKRDWLEMTYEDFQRPDCGRWIAVLPIAAVEQHGPHLPLGVDAFIAEALLTRTRALMPLELPVTFLPLQVIGASQEHRDYPGTLSLPADLTMRTLTAIGESVHRAGLRKLVIVNSHGGNVPVMEVTARDLRARFQMLAITCSWARIGFPPSGLFDAQELTHGIHAGDVETSIMLAARPELVRSEHIRNFVPATVHMAEEFKWLGPSQAAGFGWMSQDLHPSGAAGDAASATALKGEAVIRFAASAFIELLSEVDRFDLARLASGPLSSS